MALIEGQSIVVMVAVTSLIYLYLSYHHHHLIIVVVLVLAVLVGMALFLSNPLLKLDTIPWTLGPITSTSS